MADDPTAIPLDITHRSVQELVYACLLSALNLGSDQIGAIPLDITHRSTQELLYALKKAIDALVAGGGGGGDFSGPAGATLNALVRFADTTGKLGKNSLVTVDDNGNVSTPGYLALTGTPTGTPPSVGAAADDLYNFVIYCAGFEVARFGSNGTLMSAYGGFTINLTSATAKLVIGGDTTFTRGDAPGTNKIQGLVTAIRSVTASDTVDSTPGDHSIVGNSNSNLTETLVDATTNAGRILVFKNKGTGSVMTLDFSGVGGLFDTSLVTSWVLAPGDSITIQSDGTNWLTASKVVTPVGVTIGSGAFSLTVMDGRATPSSRILATLATADATASLGSVVPGSGSFTINMLSAPTSDTAISCAIFN